MKPFNAFIATVLLAGLAVSGPVSARAHGPVPALQEGPEGVEPGNDWLVMRMPAEPPNLNPITHRDAYGANTLYYLNSYLLILDKEKAALKPELCVEMPTISADHLEYTLKLRKDAKWHDGKPVTAHDVKFSFDTMMNDKVDAERTRGYYSDIKSFEVTDDHTLKVVYKQPYYFTLYSFYDFPIVPKHCFANMKDPADFNTHPYNDNPIGCGPYKLEKWEKGNQIVLVRNEEYWGRKPNLKRIVFKIIQDDTAAVAALKRGELDLMAVPPSRWEKDLKNDKELLKEYVQYEGYRPQYFYIGWNAGKPLFADKRVRKAMTMLCDVKDWINAAFYGHATQITGPHYFQSKEYVKDIKPLPFDPEKAKELLAEVGWTDSDDDGVLDKDGKKFEFEFLITTQNPYAEKLATMMKEQCKKVGILLTIRAMEWGAFLEQLNEDKFDCCTLAWSWDWPENDLYQVWHSDSIANRGSNRVKFKNEEADRLILDVRREFDDKKRMEKARKLHEIIYDEQPYTFLINPKRIGLYHKRLQNMKFDKYAQGPDPRAGIEFWVKKGEEKYK